MVGTKTPVAQVANNRPPIEERPSGAFRPGSMVIGVVPMNIANSA
jgi:hypothetical protein